MFEEEAVKHYNNLTKSALRLNEIVKEQQQRMNKAIEYIEKNMQKEIMSYGDNFDSDFEICLWEEDIDNLLEILKGE